MKLKKTVNPYAWKKKSFKERVAESKETLKTLTFRQKIDHLWTYYKGSFFAIVIGVLIVLALISTLAKANPKALYIVFCDTFCEDQEYSDRYLSDAFKTYMGDEADRKDMIKIDTSLSFRDDLSERQLKMMEQKFSAEMQAHAIDILVGNRNTIISFGELGMFCDLQELLDPQTFETLKAQDYLFTCTIPASEEDGTPELTYYCGIDLYRMGGTMLADAGFTIDEDTCLGFPYGSKRQERALKFLDMILSAK